MRTIIILIASGVLLAGCADEEGADVVAGFYPLAFAASEVGGPDVSVDNMTPPGTEPHDLEVSPKQVAKLEGAELVLLVGNGFQPQLERSAHRAARVVEVLDDPALKARGNPHVWLDPVRFAAVTRRVASVLGRPATPLTDRLAALDRQYRAGLKGCARREVVTSHDAFGYMAERYGLDEVSIGGSSPEAEPSPAALRRVIQEIRRTHATTVFSEPLASERPAATIARETGARVDTLDPVEAQPSGGRDYFDVMRQNLAKLRRALGCR